jgi:2'-5' RNA ligase
MIEKCGIELTDKNFTPHMTLMKLSKSKDLFKKGIKKIDQSIYTQLKENPFGVEHVDKIHLCSITEKDSDGFYKIEKSIDFFNIS